LKKIFIIAELGINHNGDLSIAKQLIDVAVDAGADAVKFQKRTIDEVYTEEFLNQERKSPWGTTQREQKEGLEFSYNDYVEIDKYCEEKNIPWFASAWDIESQYFLRKFDLKYNKIASPMIIYDALLHKVAAEKKHTFISTGMSDFDMISNAVRIFRSYNCPFELMHCVSTYPMVDEDANLNRIKRLRGLYVVDIGYSSHETGLVISLAAVALGITSLERHITLDRAMYGSDQPASIEPNNFKFLVGAVRKIEKSMGDGSLKIWDKELSIADKLRAHIKKD